MKTDKPTTGECSCDNSASDVIIDQYCPQHGSLKPATGEWTVETVSSIVGNYCQDTNWNEIQQRIADAHNAALAAATARELHSYDVAKLCREELAVEREKTQQCAIEGSGWHIEAQQLREQLADEREKVQTLVDALTEVREYCSGAGEMIVDAAIAKVKEGK